MVEKKKQIIFIVGPTAVGKSEVALFLAKKIKGCIISCDSMQVYKGMDILTSKLPPAERKNIKHYLIGTIASGREYNVSQYRKSALRCIKEITAKQEVPIFTGGTGLYLSALVNGLFEAKAQDTQIRKRLYCQAQDKGSNFIYEKLKIVDPLAASKIHPNDLKRIIRALEVYEATGKPISELQSKRKGLADSYDVRMFCLDMPRDLLYERINQRVENMFEKGLVKEVKDLTGKRLSLTASVAIGIKEVKGYLDGQYSLSQAKELMQRNSRHYAKRQLTWFRKDKRIKWIKIKKGDKPKGIADKIWKELS